MVPPDDVVGTSCALPGLALGARRSVRFSGVSDDETGIASYPAKADADVRVFA
jgi:hypothetical protein